MRRLLVLLLCVTGCDPLCPSGEGRPASMPVTTSTLVQVEDSLSSVALASDATRTLVVGMRGEQESIVIGSDGTPHAMQPRAEQRIASDARPALGASTSIVVGRSPTAVVGVVIDAAGTLGTRFEIAAKRTGPPAVAFDGEAFVVAYLDATSVELVRLASDGSVLSGPIVLGTHDDAADAAPIVASSGGHTWIAWGAGGRLVGVRFDRGQRLDATPRTLLEEWSNVGSIAAGPDGAMILVRTTAWHVVPLAWDGTLGTEMPMSNAWPTSIVALDDGEFAVVSERSAANRFEGQAELLVLDLDGALLTTITFARYGVSASASGAAVALLGARYESGTDGGYERLELHRVYPDGNDTRVGLVDSTRWEMQEHTTCSEPLY